MVDIFFKDRTLIFTSRFIALWDIGAELYISLDQRKKYKIFHWKSENDLTIYFSTIYRQYFYITLKNTRQKRTNLYNNYSHLLYELLSKPVSST